MIPPTMAELVEAVRERLDRAIDEPVGGFEARVVRNVLAIIERQLERGPEVDRRRAELTASFGADDDEALAAAIRAGTLDHRIAQLRRELLELAELQLRIDNPRW